jgi:cardiolipin synthase
MIIELIEAAVAIGHLLAALTVTLHVLLSHRDVRSAIGWIGLAWLSPFFGAVIYLAFGINRVARRASRLRVPATRSRADRIHPIEGDLRPNFVALAHAGGALVRHPLAAGNSWHILENGDMAFPDMLAAIDSAQSSVGLSFYIFDDDTTGRAFVDALIAAHERGVSVRVLIDGVGGGYFYSGVHDALRRAGVPVAMFLHSWLPWRMSFLNLRNHKKLLLIDGRTGFTGGMNISDRHVGGPDQPKVGDVMVRIEGPVVRQMLESFASDWEFVTDEALSGEAWWPAPTIAGDAPMRAIASGPDEDVAILEEHWASAIEQAEHSVRILTPYFLPEDRILDVLARSTLRGVMIELLIPERSNHFYMDWAARAHLDALPLSRVRCYLTPEPFDHSKLMTVDGKWCCFGSPNWDARSMRLNFELMVESYDVPLTVEIDALIAKRRQGARRLDNADLAARRPPVRLRDASARLLLPYL